MEKKWEYNGSSNMSDLVERNYRVLIKMSCFGIRLGFGDKSIREVCEENDVDTKTFLTIVNMMLNGNKASYDISKISPAALLDYLKNTHDYLLNFRFPSIRKDLIKALGCFKDDLAKVLIRYFDEYVELDVHKHILYEENTVFPYVRSLMQDGNGKIHGSNPYKKHDYPRTNIAEFERIMVKYYPAQSTNRLNKLLFDIKQCESDMISHGKEEDMLLLPIIRDLERKLKEKT